MRQIVAAHEVASDVFLAADSREDTTVFHRGFPTCQIQLPAGRIAE